MNSGPLIASYRNRELQIVFMVTLTALLGVSTISPALPRIMAQLDLSVTEVGLLITVFTMPGMLLTPILGVLADRFGRKRILVPSLILFATAGSACALARDFELLLLLRLLQGMGAAPLGSLNLTIIGDLFDGRERTAAMGFNASVLSVGAAAYPALGGALATFAWYYPFALPILALPVALLVAIGFKDREPRRQPALGKYLGAVWREICHIEILALFVVSTVIFVLLYGAYITFFPLLLEARFTAGPFQIGLMMSMLSVVTAVACSQLGRLAKRVPERHILAAGLVFFAVGLAGIPLAETFWALIIPGSVLGLGFATSIPPAQSLLAGFAADPHRAAIMSLNGMVLRMGQTVGPLLMAMIHETWGMNVVYLVGAGLALTMAGLVTALVDPAQPKIA